MAPAFISDPPFSSKKKRINGSAKLKQIKLDVRREQWLSKVKKECNIDSNGRVDSCPSSKHIASEENQSPYKENRRKGGEDSKCVLDSSIQSTYNRDVSRNGFTGSSNSSRSSTSTFSSGNLSEEDGCLDDWETVADALYTDDNEHSTVLETPSEDEMKKSCINSEAANSHSIKEFRSAVSESHISCRAWKPDDTLRPRCLPDLTKTHSSSLNTNFYGSHKVVPWSWQTIISQPCHCPICYEDLDVTDVKFLPCSCGFHLCLFCHKKIIEADGRCPGCRKLYDHVDENNVFNIEANAFHITQTCSMSTRC
ncbi:uncharacterized protein LOC131627011 [Vicia villosa]|uniref:uncharacterized protein LOC131627011 n=1 Tax=Vicia villosa TaxID=3911 RepID=UPI00273C1E22|nr:uncharacterized protein LOC131627011 [Vicia villosa]